MARVEDVETAVGEAPPGACAADEPVALLLARHGRQATAHLREVFGRVGLGPRHGAVLSHLADQASTGGGPATQRSLQQAVGMDPSSLATILADLEGAGLVARDRDPRDRRRVLVTVTPAGTAARDQLSAGVEALESHALGDLSPSERGLLRDLLRRVRLDGGDACS